RKPPADPPPASPPPPPPPPPDPPAPPRTPEEEFWDEDPEPFEEEEQEPAPPTAPPPVPPPPRSSGAGGKPPAQRPSPGVLGALRRHPFRVAGVIVALLILWFLIALFQPFHGDGSGRVEVDVPKGASVSEVGDLLGEKGVISSSTLFQVRVTIEG